MDKNKLQKISGELEKARRQVSNLKTADMVRLATSLERTLAAGKSGHLVYKSPLPGRTSLVITNHPKPIKRGLALAQINFLEGDIEAWEELLDQAERGDS